MTAIRAAADPGRRSALVALGGVLPRVSRFDALAAGAYLIAAGLVTARLWGAGTDRVTTDNVRDNVFFQFVFAHVARSVTHLENPLFSDQLNAPDGVNMMANTSMLGISVPLVPVTLAVGPAASFAVAVSAGLAATALAWYVFLRRHVTNNRLVAFAAGGFGGFAPGVVGHSNGHPNIVAQFMVPLIISRVIRLRDDPVRNGVVLGLMITYQLFVNEEILLLTALVCGVMLVVWAASHREEVRRSARPFAAGLGLATAVAGPLIAYPLWFQFFGPQHYRGPFSWAQNFGLDALAYPAFAPQSLAGHTLVKNSIEVNPAEMNAFLGWPLCVLAIVVGITLWRQLAARIALIVAALFGLLSFGNTLTVNGRPTGIAGPWRVFTSLPLFDSIIVSRLALVVTAAVGVLLAVAGDWVASAIGELPAASRRRAIALSCGALAAILLPVAPTPTRGSTPASTPTFFSAGAWRDFVDEGTVVPVPPDTQPATTMRWLISADMGFRLADGYFLGPTSDTDPTAAFGPFVRPTGRLLAEVAETGKMPIVTDEMRGQALADLTAWRADVLVLGPRVHQEALRKTVDELTGLSGVLDGGVWAWDVRGLV